MLLSILISSLAQLYIRITYSRYSREETATGYNGAEAAMIVLRNNGLNDVSVNSVGGYLSDHYDPRSRQVRLSQNNYSGRSIAAVAVACHECGHALQDQSDYLFMKVRSSLVPAVNFSSYAGYLAISIGLMTGIMKAVWAGIILEMVILLFQIVTLPVEIDASRRALRQIEELNILDGDQYLKSRKVLTAAALTYVAGVLTTLLEIARLILMLSNRRRRD